MAGSTPTRSALGTIGASSTSNPLSAVLSTYGNGSIDTTPRAFSPVPLAVRYPYLLGFHLSSPTETCRIPPSSAVQCSASETPTAVHIGPDRRLSLGQTPSKRPAHVELDPGSAVCWLPAAVGKFAEHLSNSHFQSHNPEAGTATVTVQGSVHGEFHAIVGCPAQGIPRHCLPCADSNPVDSPLL